MATAPGINLGASFNGLQFNDSSFRYVPPDTIAAVGQSHVVETINTVMRVSNKDGSGATTVQLGNLFPSSTATDLFDPVVFYDDISKRFVVSAMEKPGGLGDLFPQHRLLGPEQREQLPVHVGLSDQHARGKQLG